MSNLVQSTKDSILQIAKFTEETHTMADVLRVVRDQANLLYERQILIDALTQDPYQAFSDFEEDIERLKHLFQIISCHRVVTYDGLSSIQAVVQIQKDSVMNNEIKSFIQLSFNYERHPLNNRKKCQNNSDDDKDDGIEEGMGTYIKYSIDLSKDYNKKHPFLRVECWAVGESPSQQPAIPLDGWDDINDDEMTNSTVGCKSNLDSNSYSEMEIDEKDVHADRYAAYIDPTVMESFKQCLGINMDEATILFLLMTLPFWEHEWDLLGFLLQEVFGYDSEEDDMIEFDEEGKKI